MISVKKVRLLCCLVLFAAGPAYAQVTTCHGDICVEDDGAGKTRQLSDAEVAKMQRGESRRSIESIKCHRAKDPKMCEQLQGVLFLQFPF